MAYNEKNDITEQAFRQFVATATGILQDERLAEDETLELSFLQLIDKVREELTKEEQVDYNAAEKALETLHSALRDDIEIKLNSLRKTLAEVSHYFEKINLFSILKMEHKENPQTYFMAWLLDPEGSHDLGDTFLKEFLRKACEIDDNCQFEDLNTKSVRVAAQQSAEESGVPDIVIVGDNFICVVENKILAGETMIKGVCQTERYANYYNKIAEETGINLLLIFLVPKEEKEPTDKRFQQMLYTDLLEIVESAIRKSSIKQDVAYLTNMFLYNIRREICHEYDAYFEANKLIVKPREEFRSSDKYEHLNSLVEKLCGGIK